MEVQMEVDEFVDEDFEDYGLNPLLTDTGRLSLDPPRFQDRLVSFFSLKDLKTLRLVNLHCNNWVLSSPKFQERYIGYLSESWHKNTRGLNINTTVAWKYLHLGHFSFRRNSNIFPKYFGKTSLNLKELTISHSSLDSEGFSCLLYRSPHLESLTLDSVKLRDSEREFALKTLEDHIHFPPNSVQMEKEALRMRKGLKNLKLCNMYIMNDLSLYHLVSRSGFLESLSLVKCVKYNLNAYDPKQRINKGVPLETRVQGFMDCILKIVTRNVETLRKLCLDDNNFPEDTLGVLAPIFVQLRLTDLKLNLTKTTSASPSPSPFMVLSNLILPEMDWPILEKFSLEFDGELSVENMKSILEKAGNTLKEFHFIMRENHPANKIELQSHLSKLKVLEKLYIKDGNDTKLGKKTPSSSDTATETYRSDVGYELLSDLPRTVKELSLCHIISEQDISCVLETTSFAEKFCNTLTKLEIRGPVRIPLSFQFGNLINQMKQLRCLFLPNCDLTDTHLTGLPHETARYLRSCFTYLFLIDDYLCLRDTNAPGCPRSNHDIWRKQVEALKNCKNPNQEFRFNELPELLHLDLSFNPRISDVSIVYSMTIPKLKTLNMEFCDKITDAGLEIIPRQLPNLEEFNLRHCRGISKHGMNRLIHGCMNLKKIYTTKVIHDKDFKDQGIPILSLSMDFHSIVQYGACQEDILQSRDLAAMTI